MSNNIKTTLLFLKKDNKVLMIKHKRGWGKGKFNLPGGKVEENETCLDNAIRETYDETGINVKNTSLLGILYFDGIKEQTIENHVFVAEYDSGELSDEHEEVAPLWMDIDKIPYDNMWDDDRYWYLYLFTNKEFCLHMNFDENGKVLDMKVLDFKKSVSNESF